MAQQMNTTTPDTSPIPNIGELDMALRDLRETGRSSAADRALRLARAALAQTQSALRAEVAS